MTLPPPIVRRLALIKYMFREGLEQSRRPSPAFVTGLLTFHDAVELFLHLACDHHGAALKPKASLEDYFAALNEKVGPVANKVTMMKLNEARRNLKHHGNLPHAEDMESFRFGMQAFFDENTPVLFNGLRFSDVSLIDMVACEKAREHLAAAEDHWRRGRPGEARSSLALAYHELHWDYMERNRDRWGRTPFDFGPSFSAFIGSRLGLEGEARRFVDDVLESIKQMRSALEVMVLGIDYKKYVEFDTLTPGVLRTMDGRTHLSPSFSSAELKQEEYDRCFSFIIEAALKLQEFDFAFVAARAETV